MYLHMRGAMSAVGASRVRFHMYMGPYALNIYRLRDRARSQVHLFCAIFPPLADQQSFQDVIDVILTSPFWTTSRI